MFLISLMKEDVVLALLMRGQERRSQQSGWLDQSWPDKTNESSVVRDQAGPGSSGGGGGGAGCPASAAVPGCGSNQGSGVSASLLCNLVQTSPHCPPALHPRRHYIAHLHL